MFTCFDFFLSIPKPGTKHDEERLKFKLENSLPIADEKEADEFAFRILEQFQPDQKIEIEVEITETLTEIPRRAEENVEQIADGWIYSKDKNGKIVKVAKIQKPKIH